MSKIAISVESFNRSTLGKFSDVDEIEVGGVMIKSREWTISKPVQEYANYLLNLPLGAEGRISYDQYRRRTHNVVSPVELGRLAAHVEKALRENPCDPPLSTADKPAPVPAEDGETMEPWEKALSTAIDEDARLDFWYVDVPEELIDMLIDYYSKGH